MIASMILAQAAAPPAAVEQEVVVIARRLDRFRASVAFEPAGPQCRIAVSSGDSVADAVGCGAITTCYPAMERRRADIARQALKGGARKRAQALLDRDLQACFARETRAGIAALAARRAAGGQP